MWHLEMLIKLLGAKVQEGKFKPNKEVNHSHEGSIGNLCLKEIKDKMMKAL